MSALIYIVRKSVINGLRELRNKPAKLSMYILLAAVVVAVAIISAVTRGSGRQSAPMFWLTGILFLFITLFVIIALAKGLSDGDTIFDMNDVNLLFVSPVNPRRILLYGVVRMAKAAFAACFFILFQTSSFAIFGVGYGGVLLTFAGFMLGMLALTTASLLIYSVTNGRPARKLAVKCLGALLFLPLLAYAAVRYFATTDLVAALTAAIESPFLRFVPVAGWTASGIAAFLSGETASGLLFFGLNLLLLAVMLTYITLSNPDYYEDVLVATETAFEKKRALAEGNIGAATAPGKAAVKLKKTGVSGSGATAIFYKHMRENFRQNRFGVLTLSDVLIVAGAVVFARIAGDLFAVLPMLMWMQVFLIGTGRGLKETYSHYIYMIPESSFKKIVWSSMEIVARTLVESALVFGVSGLLIQAPVPRILTHAAAYALFSFVLLGVNYLAMRFTGADLSAGLMVVLYFLAVLIVMSPGVALAIVTGVALSAVNADIGLNVGLLVLSGWEVAAGLGCFALARGVLHNCDMASMNNRR